MGRGAAPWPSQTLEDFPMTTLSDDVALAPDDPALVIILLIGVFPLFYNLYLSLHFWNMTRPMRFIWFKNYTDLFGSTIFWEAFGRTMIFLVSAVSLEMVLETGRSISFNRSSKARTSLSHHPHSDDHVHRLVGLIWRYMYNGEFGFVSWILTLLGFSGHAILSNPAAWRPVVSFSSTYGTACVVFLLLPPA